MAGTPEGLCAFSIKQRRPSRLGLVSERYKKNANEVEEGDFDDLILRQITSSVKSPKVPHSGAAKRTISIENGAQLPICWWISYP